MCAFVCVYICIDYVCSFLYYIDLCKLFFDVVK